MGNRLTVSKRTLAMIFTAAMLAGCSGEELSEPIAAGPAEITAGDQIAKPTSKTILKISGEISQENSEKGLRLDLTTLESMPTVEATVFEPFLKKDVTFSGVMMDDLIEIIGTDAAAAGIHMTALDDYTADLPMADLTSGDVMLATRQDGKPLKVRAGGPSRIIFLNDDGLGANTDMWVWSVEHMDVHH